jgi:hypothetical protein
MEVQFRAQFSLIACATRDVRTTTRPPKQSPVIHRYGSIRPRCSSSCNSEVWHSGRLGTAGGACCTCSRRDPPPSNGLGPPHAKSGRQTVAAPLVAAESLPRWFPCVVQDEQRATTERWMDSTGFDGCWIATSCNLHPSSTCLLFDASSRPSRFPLSSTANMSTTMSSVKRGDEEAIDAGSPPVYYAAAPFKGSALLHLGANANHKGKNYR